MNAFRTRALPGPCLLANDPKLTALLRRAGEQGDVFKAIWNAGRSAPLGTHVTPEDRDKAKRTVYGILYGQGKVGLAEKLGVSQDTAQGLMTAFFATFPGVQRFVQRIKETARRTGYVTLPSGRHRPLPGFGSSKPSERAEAERKAVNTLVQGSAADMMKAAMVRWVSAVGTVCAGGGHEATEFRDVAGRADPTRVRLVAQIHDELLFECVDGRYVCEAAALVRRCMEEAAPHMPVPTPAKVSVGRTWAELRPLDEWVAANGGDPAAAGAGETQ